MDRIIDSLGRITIPKAVRKQLNIADNDTVELYVEDDAIVLRPKEKNVNDLRRITKVVIDTKKINDIKNKYHKDDLVRLINMESEDNLIPRGMTGKVVTVDDLGSVHVKWENGMELAVLNIPGDVIEKVK